MSGRKNSSSYKLNGVALAVAFFVTRIVAFGWGLVHMWHNRWACNLVQVCCLQTLSSS